MARAFKAANNNRLPVEDPCTGRAYGELPVGSAAEVDGAVQAAKAALHNPAWRDLPPLRRERLMFALAEAIERDLPRMAALEALDTGWSIALTETVDIPAACVAAHRRRMAPENHGPGGQLGGRVSALPRLRPP
jgi:acyl-CoA reductase-like NAD-dependent aldehyde dehydrogenase